MATYDAIELALLKWALSVNEAKAQIVMLQRLVLAMGPAMSIAVGGGALGRLAEFLGMPSGELSRRVLLLVGRNHLTFSVPDKRALVWDQVLSLNPPSEVLEGLI